MGETEGDYFFTFHFPLGEFEMVTYFPLKERAEPLLGGEEGGVLLLGYPEEEVGVVAAATGFKENAVAGVVVECRSAREDPQVTVGAATDKGIGIVVGEHHDAIIGIERSPEGDTEDAWLIGELSFADGGVPLAVLHAVVGDDEFAIVLQRVGGSALFHSTFELMVVARYFIPFTKKTLEVDILHGGVIDGERRAAHEDADDNCQQYHEEKNNTEATSVSAFLVEA